MKKLIRGIVDFRRKRQAGYLQQFGSLAHGQAPDALLIACADSRVVPNLFASTDPGDLFVVRNVGNLVPPHVESDADADAAVGRSEPLAAGDASALSAVEFAVVHLGVRDIIVCGHSDCGAMHALLRGRDQLAEAHLRHWLQHGEPALQRLHEAETHGDSPANALSKQNVLQQVAHLRTHPLIAERQVRLHGWWFDIGTADVQVHDETTQRFVVLDEAYAETLLTRLTSDAAEGCPEPTPPSESSHRPSTP